MATAGVTQHPTYQVRDTIPDGEIELVARLREVNPVQSAKHVTRFVPVRVCKPALAQRVEEGNGQQGGFHAVTRDVEQIKGEPLRIHPMITEAIAAKAC